MPFVLVHIRPDGTEHRIPAQATARKAAVYAGMSLYDNRRATKAEAQKFSARLTKLPTGETLTHEASGYAARIEKE